jgi:hypothetical protein
LHSRNRAVPILRHATKSRHHVSSDRGAGKWDPTAVEAKLLAVARDVLCYREVLLVQSRVPLLRGKRLRESRIRKELGIRAGIAECVQVLAGLEYVTTH